MTLQAVCSRSSGMSAGISRRMALLNFLWLRMSSISPAMSRTSSSWRMMSSFLVIRKCELAVMVSSGNRVCAWWLMSSSEVMMWRALSSSMKWNLSSELGMGRKTVRVFLSASWSFRTRVI